MSRNSTKEQQEAEPSLYEIRSMDGEKEVITYSYDSHNHVFKVYKVDIWVKILNRYIEVIPDESYNTADAIDYLKFVANHHFSKFYPAKRLTGGDAE